MMSLSPITRTEHTADEKVYLCVEYEIPVLIQCHKQFSYFGGGNISYILYLFFFQIM